jgi:PBP1b-binding outer membrane lipoprotein LpoB
MKKFILISLVAFLLQSCVKCDDCEPKVTKKLENYVTVIELDSCEYIQSGERGWNSYAITHKGNCKYCEERRRLNK